MRTVKFPKNRRSQSIPPWLFDTVRKGDGKFDLLFSSRIMDDAGFSAFSDAVNRIVLPVEREVDHLLWDMRYED